MYEGISDTWVFTAVGRHHCPKIYFCLHSSIFCSEFSTASQVSILGGLLWATRSYLGAEEVGLSTGWEKTQRQGLWGHLSRGTCSLSGGNSPEMLWSPIFCLIWSSIEWCSVLDHFPFGVLVLLIKSSENMPARPWAHLLQTISSRYYMFLFLFIVKFLVFSFYQTQINSPRISSLTPPKP